MTRLLAGILVLACWAGTVSAEVSITRGYVDGPHGQVHFRHAVPDTANAPPLVLFHHTPGSSRYFTEFMAEMATDREVFAFDTPGYGQSDAPAEALTLEGYAAALAAVLPKLGLGDKRPFDALGFLTGSFLATEIAVTHPTWVRRLTLGSSPVWTDEERPGRFARWDDIETWSDDGGYVVRTLTSTMERSRALDETPEEVLERLEGFEDGLIPREKWVWAEFAAMNYRAIEKQPLITQPTLALIFHDFAVESVARSEELIPDVRVKDMRLTARFAFRRIPGQIAGEVRTFLE